MSEHNSLAELCMAFVRLYAFAGCNLYPISLEFDTRRSTFQNLRRNILLDCNLLCLAMKDLLSELGYDVESNARDFALIGFMTCPVDTRPLLDEPAKPTATLVVCLPKREGKDQFLEKLIPQHKEALIAACPHVVDIKIDVSFGDDGSVGFLLEEPFEGGIGSQDLIFVSSFSAEIKLPFLFNLEEGETTNTVAR